MFYLKQPLTALAVTILFAAMAAPQTSVMTLNGSAKLTTAPNGIPVLWLTPNQTSQAGSAFLTNKVVFGAKYQFSTFFQFRMTDPVYQSSDGMAFVIQAESPNALGGSGGCLGYAGFGSCTPPFPGGIAPSI